MPDENQPDDERVRYALPSEKDGLDYCASVEEIAHLRFIEDFLRNHTHLILIASDLEALQGMFTQLTRYNPSRDFWAGVNDAMEEAQPHTIQDIDVDLVRIELGKQAKPLQEFIAGLLKHVEG